MNLNKLSSAIYNDLFSGNLIPASNRSLISMEQIEDEIIMERSAVIKEMYLKNLLSRSDVMVAINCVAVDCKDQNKCTCGTTILNTKKAKHIEIPQLMDGVGDAAIEFIGSTDRTIAFDIYYNLEDSKYHQYKRIKSNKPYVYIERTPNENNKYDCWIFNAPVLQYVAVIGIFKDPRQLKEYSCCTDTEYLELGSISNDVKNRILARKVQLYRTYTPASSQTVG